MNAQQVREEFLKYFTSKDHKVVASSSLIPFDDPTLLFTNAGMNQFKDIFLGNEQRDYQRATSSQKCVRAGGKHNDLENVGVTARHHTFFEMLGNFSFGDYFKQEAIEYAWEFITEVVKLDKSRLWVSVFRDDDEAFAIWRDHIGVPSERILRCDEKDNFWQMGETGPCGPCSEIHFDQGPAVPCTEGGECGVECECDRYLEIWNLVFMQYDRQPDGTLNPLPKPSIDTGMGLERLAAVVQGEYSNYHTDLFMPILQKIAADCGRQYTKSDSADDVSMRVIADHLRAATFLIGDGAIPSNEGRGYVLRRIMRRAMRHANQLGRKEPYMYTLVALMEEHYGHVFPEITHNRHMVEEIIYQEERRFATTLDHGLGILHEMIQQCRQQEQGQLDGASAFKLYDTYGFPLDLTMTIAEDAGMTVDEEGFYQAMQEQKERARASWKATASVTSSEDLRHLESRHQQEFVGYDFLTSQSQVVGLLNGNDEAVAQAKAGEKVVVVLDRTPFYAESGGQASDTGVIASGGDAIFEVSSVRKSIGGLFLHHGVVSQGTLSVADTVNTTVNSRRRRSITLNHSATHLLHTALANVVGEHVRQAGSQVEEGRLRFDFTHWKGLDRQQLQEVETQVNAQIMANHQVRKETMALDQAVEKGAAALFGEKYGEEVRVVSMGDYSMELCGGTHVEATGQIGLFTILSEGAISSGVRRIEATTGMNALDHFQQTQEILQQLADTLKSQPQDLGEKVEKLLESQRQLERKSQQLAQQLSAKESSAASEQMEQIGGCQVLLLGMENKSADELKQMVDSTRNQQGECIVALASATDGKAIMVVGVSDNLAQRVKAGDIVKVLASACGGGGGGRPTFAQAGGKQPDQIPYALQQARDFIAQKLK
ncbi:alanine--tRNA ligase [Desulfurispira natronophila]|uniref:Alanine--tRNA ligase n=1 Tax=Desulfurispira natronophila TaxID=682562 RepID=A0A7W8DGQ4_9BACT|nr:alanine--tRNA ligase [Desulfurispira natronophila]MBB5021721.1 alanyl-tRNA synthetase [Desulfurispira natronophila]